MLLPLWHESLTPEIEEIAKRELGETPEVREQCIKELKGLLKEVPDLNPRLDDPFLLRFLRARKFHVRRTLKTICNFYMFKVRYSGILTDFLPSDRYITTPGDNQPCCMAVMHKRTKEHIAVGVLRLGLFDYNVVTPNMIFAACLVYTELFLEMGPTQVCGYAIIFDFEGMTLSTFKRFASPTFLYRLVKLVQDCIPARMKGFHMVNEPYFFSGIYKIVKMFLSEKLASRFHLHGKDMESLHKYIPAEILPQELGGLNGPMENRDFDALGKSKEAHLKKMNEYGFHGDAVQEVKRKNSRSLFD